MSLTKALVSCTIKDPKYSILQHVMHLNALELTIDPASVRRYREHRKKTSKA